MRAVAQTPVVYNIERHDEESGSKTCRRSKVLSPTKTTELKRKPSASAASSKAVPSKAFKSPEDDHDASQMSAHEGGKNLPKAAVARKQSKVAKEPLKDKSQVEEKVRTLM
ncbi:hypothetical protein MTO96_022910 [Rhipicephalus appendiculatus]